ncbi:hypothetical protein Pla52n_68780 [Stieleria varia]|uniref:Uncharacterized protein n=1 Tax=Stieleria varia TaxID=2528005 RepID=A0A5C5ZP51_9BACT|nr:hypothetical protein Pla52n_68780 [Stieleria varia]
MDQFGQTRHGQVSSIGQIAIADFKRFGCVHVGTTATEDAIESMITDQDVITVTTANHVTIGTGVGLDDLLLTTNRGVEFDREGWIRDGSISEVVCPYRRDVTGKRAKTRSGREPPQGAPANLGNSRSISS